jgi:hypothetical protein
LVIPTGHGSQFTASMEVTFVRENQRTLVQETLTGTFRHNWLHLVGVNYSYIEKGSSTSYSLESFELQPSPDRKSLVGKARLLHGERDVTFTRQKICCIS